MEPAILGVSLTVLFAVIGLFFRAGHLAARVEELERWRRSMRDDMHEISEMIMALGRKVEQLAVLMSERTERRFVPRDEDHR